MLTCDSDFSFIVRSLQNIVLNVTTLPPSDVDCRTSVVSPLLIDAGSGPAHSTLILRIFAIQATYHLQRPHSASRQLFPTADELFFQSGVLDEPIPPLREIVLLQQCAIYSALCGIWRWILCVEASDSFRCATFVDWTACLVCFLLFCSSD